MMGSMEKFVGTRMRERRLSLGMSEAELAEHIGVGAYRVPEFELGRRHIPPRVLIAIAGELAVPVSYFFLSEAARIPMPSAAGHPLARHLIGLFYVERETADPVRRRWIDAMLRRLEAIGSEMGRPSATGPHPPEGDDPKGDDRRR